MKDHENSKTEQPSNNSLTSMMQLIYFDLSYKYAKKK